MVDQGESSNLDPEDRFSVDDETGGEYVYYAEIGLRQLDHQFELIKLIIQEATSAFTIGSTILALVAAFAGSDWQKVRSTPVALIALTLALLA